MWGWKGLVGVVVGFTAFPILMFLALVATLEIYFWWNGREYSDKETTAK